MKATTEGIIVFLLIVLISCNKHQDQLIVENINKEVIDWDVFIIKQQGQTIIVDRNEGYGVRDTCDFEEVKIDVYTTEYRPINRGEEYFDISQQEKDSLFKYVYDIVVNPVYTDQYATCYAGNISIEFRSGNTTLLCKYNSVGNWTTISPSTECLYRLLNEKTKIED